MKALRFFMIEFLVWYAIYSAGVKDIVWIETTLEWFFGLLAFCVIVASFHAPIDRQEREVPIFVAWLCALGMIVCLVYVGWYFIATEYASSVILYRLIPRKDKEAKE